MFLVKINMPEKEVLPNNLQIFVISFTIVGPMVCVITLKASSFATNFIVFFLMEL